MVSRLLCHPWVEAVLAIITRDEWHHQRDRIKCQRGVNDGKMMGEVATVQSELQSVIDLTHTDVSVRWKGEKTENFGILKRGKRLVSEFAPWKTNDILDLWQDNDSLQFARMVLESVDHCQLSSWDLGAAARCWYSRMVTLLVVLTKRDDGCRQHCHLSICTNITRTWDEQACLDGWVKGLDDVSGRLKLGWSTLVRLDPPWSTLVPTGPSCLVNPQHGLLQHEEPSWERDRELLQWQWQRGGVQSFNKNQWQYKFLAQIYRVHAHCNLNLKGYSIHQEVEHHSLPQKFTRNFFLNVQSWCTGRPATKSEPNSSFLQG